VLLTRRNAVGRSRRANIALLAHEHARGRLADVERVWPLSKHVTEVGIGHADDGSRQALRESTRKATSEPHASQTSAARTHALRDRGCRTSR
jgi:hypothetical protein